MIKDKNLATPAKIRFFAMNLLTGRDFSRAELNKKLKTRFDDDPAIAPILDQLEMDRLQSDSRYAAAFVRFRVSRGHGEIRIRLESEEKGIPEELINLALDEEGADWFVLAHSVAVRKFGSVPAADLKSKSKRMRFLHVRGFTIEQIEYALGRDDDGCQI